MESGNAVTVLNHLTNKYELTTLRRNTDMFIMIITMGNSHWNNKLCFHYMQMHLKMHRIP